MEGMENTLCNKLYSPMQNDGTFCRNLSTLTQTTSGGSRPSDKEEGLVIQTLSWGGGGQSQKNVFLALWASVWSKNKGGQVLPWSGHWQFPLLIDWKGCLLYNNTLGSWTYILSMKFGHWTIKCFMSCCSTDVFPFLCDKKCSIIFVDANI